MRRREQSIQQGQKENSTPEFRSQLRKDLADWGSWREADAAQATAKLHSQRVMLDVTSPHPDWRTEVWHLTQLMISPSPIGLRNVSLCSGTGRFLEMDRMLTCKTAIGSVPSPGDVAKNNDTAPWTCGCFL